MRKERIGGILVTEFLLLMVVLLKQKSWVLKGEVFTTDLQRNNFSHAFSLPSARDLPPDFGARNLPHRSLCVASLIPGAAPVWRDYWGQAAVLGAGGRWWAEAFHWRGNNLAVAMYQKLLEELLLQISWHLLPPRDLLMDPSPQLKEHKSVSVGED